MSCILHIETSTRVCSVALSQDGLLMFHKEEMDGPNHAVSCPVFVQEAMDFVKEKALTLDAVAVSEGPGSYTGLRIGVSTAKGVSYGSEIPLLGIPTLQTLCVPVLLYHEEVPEDALLVPMIDARRMEVYAAVYDRALREVRPAQADIVGTQTYDAYLQRGPVCFFGDGASKCKAVITHPNAVFIDDIVPLARHMFPLAETAMARGEVKDTAYFEPFYLKDFIATKSRDMLANLA